MSDCLHCDINRTVEEHLARIKPGETIDVSELAAKMAESLADLILHSAPVEERPKLIAHTLASFGQFLLEKGEAGEGETTH